MKSSTTIRESCFDKLQKNFWERGQKAINKDQIYRFFKLKKNIPKEQNYSIDLKLFQFKKIQQSKNSSIVVKYFNLIITSYRVLDEHQSKNLVKHDKPIFGWEFYRNSTTFQIFTNEKNTHDEFNALFTRICIMNDFHDKYDCIKVIGSGAFGQMFQAKRKNTDLLFAVKGLNKTYISQQPKALQGLSNEILIMRQLNYSSISKLEEVFETKNSIYLIFEFHSGGHLLDRFNGKNALRLSLKIVNSIMKNLVSAVSYMHSKDIMHRNINPDNIVFRNQADHTDVILSEFGFADSSKNPKMIYKRCGTPGFFAPEVLSYREGDTIYDQQCDIFSLGAIFYVLLTGQNPFESKQEDILIQQNREGEVNFDHPALLKRPETTLDLLQQMLTVNPYERITIYDALNHSYFQPEYAHQESQLNNMGSQNSQQQPYSQFTKQESKLRSLKFGSSQQFFSNVQFLTMQRLPIGSQLSPEGSPQNTSQDIYQGDKNYLGYDPKEKKGPDSEPNISRRPSGDEISLNKRLANTKSRFQNMNNHQDKQLDRTLTDELQDCSDGHNIQQMMSQMNSYSMSARSCEVNTQEHHSAQNHDDMNFRIQLQSMNKVEYRSYPTEKKNMSQQ